MKHVNVHAVHELDQFSRKCLPKDVSASGGTTPWRAFQPEPEAGDLPFPTTRRGWVAGATEMSRLAHPLGTPRAVAFRPSAVRATPPARVPNCEGETSPLLTALMTTESAISGRNSFLGGCRCGRPRTPVRSGRVDHGGSAYQQPPPRRDSPPYRRRPRCTPGGGGVGPPRGWW